MTLWKPFFAESESDVTFSRLQGMPCKKVCIVGSVAGAFFRLRPSGFSAPEWPLLQRRLLGHGWLLDICQEAAVTRYRRRSASE